VAAGGRRCLSIPSNLAWSILPPTRSRSRLITAFSIALALGTLTFTMLLTLAPDALARTVHPGSACTRSKSSSHGTHGSSRRCSRRHRRKVIVVRHRSKRQVQGSSVSIVNPPSEVSVEALSGECESEGAGECTVELCAQESTVTAGACETHAEEPAAEPETAIEVEDEAEGAASRAYAIVPRSALASAS
jgi:hypothetical protein